MARYQPILNPFVGREDEQALYQQFLTWATPWVLMIVGDGGIGKSALLRRYRTKSSPHAFPIMLDFAVPSLQADLLTVLEEIVEQLEPACAPTSVEAFGRELEDGRSRLVELSSQVKEIKQEIHAEAYSTIKGMDLNISMAQQEQRREIYKPVIKAFYALLPSLNQDHLVLLLDTCEWLAEATGLEVGKWLLDELLPGIQRRLQQRQKKYSVVIASRVKLQINAIERQEQYTLKLSRLNKQDVDSYLVQIGMRDAAMQQRVYEITQGHALCVSILGALWQEQGDEHPLTLADLPKLQEQFNEQALLEYIQVRLEQRLRSPFRELTRYGVLLRNFDLPMLQAIFPDLLPEQNALDLFQQLLRYPYIESLGNHKYALHDLLRSLQAAHIRAQEPQVWQHYHKSALDYLNAVSPASPDCFYHALAYNEEQGLPLWQETAQEAQLRGRREYLNQLLQAAQDTALKLSPAAHALCVLWQGRFYYYGSNMSDALSSYEEALGLYEQVGDRLGEANVLQAMGDVQQFRKDMQAALNSYEEALGLFQQVGSKLGEANCYLAQGHIALQKEEYKQCLALYTHAYSLYQHIQDHYSQCAALYYRSYVYEAMNERNLALQDSAVALAMAEQLALPQIDIFASGTTI